MSEVPEKFLEVTASNGDYSIHFNVRGDGSVIDAYASLGDATQINLERKTQVKWSRGENPLFVHADAKSLKRLWKTHEKLVSPLDREALAAFMADRLEPKAESDMTAIRITASTIVIPGYQPINSGADISYVKFERSGQYSASGGHVTLKGSFETEDWSSVSEIKIKAGPGDAEKFLRLMHADLPTWLLDWAAAEAYDNGHSAGEEEVVSILSGMLNGLSDAYNKRNHNG